MDEHFEPLPPAPRRRWLESWEDYHRRFLSWDDRCRKIERRNDERRDILEPRRLEEQKRLTAKSARTRSYKQELFRESDGSRDATPASQYCCPKCSEGFTDYGAYVHHLETQEDNDEDNEVWPKHRRFAWLEEAAHGGEVDEDNRVTVAGVRGLERSYERQAYLADSEYVERYARDHREELLENRKQILRTDEVLMEREELIRYLRSSRPTTAEQILAAARFEVRALAIAETFVRPRESAEEWRARHERHLARRLEDAKARKAQELLLRKNLEAFLSEHGVADLIEREKQIENMLRQILPETHHAMNSQDEEDGHEAVDEDVEVLGR